MQARILRATGAIMFKPTFTIGPKIATALMRIESHRQAVEQLPLSVRMLDSLRTSARLLSTHYSTQIEGNRLTPGQVKQVLRGKKAAPGRERDEREVRFYYQALEYMEETATESSAISEAVIRTLHGLVEFGKRKATPYRDGQNVIRDSRTKRIVYLPPEAKDVPRLMKDLVAWVQKELRLQELPVPVIAALAHYQFATIHPYFDGNGRTARLLTTLILHRGGYGLKGIYSLEEYYAKHLSGYYEALTVGKSHNYYEGRAEGDCSKFVEYFCVGMAKSFETIRKQAVDASEGISADVSPRLRLLQPAQRTALQLFLDQKTASSQELGDFLGIKRRSASILANKWVKEGFLEHADSSKKARRYQLTPLFEQIVSAGQ